MTDQELIAYFEHAKLPDTLRLDRASTQLHVAEAVQRNIELMQSDPKDTRSRHRLRMIVIAMETPFNGQEIPRF